VPEADRLSRRIRLLGVRAGALVRLDDAAGELRPAAGDDGELFG